MRSFSNSLIARRAFRYKVFLYAPAAQMQRGGCVIIFPQTPDTGGACTKQASERGKSQPPLIIFPTSLTHLHCFAAAAAAAGCFILFECR